MVQNRVVVTGIGIVSPLGIGLDVTWRAVVESKSGLNVIRQFDPSESPCKIAAEVKNFDSQKYFDSQTIRMNPRYAQFGLLASREALKQASLVNVDKERIGVVLGTSAAGLTFSLSQYDVFNKHGYRSMDTFLTSIMNNGVGTRSIVLEHGFKGISNTFTSTCVASTDAIGYAFSLIRNGKMDAMIAGGAESCISPSTVAGFHLSRILSKKEEAAPSPFDRHRDGTVLGEGSAILVLEEYRHARRRKARIFGEVIGFGATSDAYHVVQPDPAGEQGVRAMRLALKDAGIRSTEVGYINAHGTGTKRNDEAETKIIKKVFGKSSRKIPVSGTKSMTGHLLGAAGALESALCLMSLREGIIPPTINYKTPDPLCDLDVVPNVARKGDVRIAANISLGFGGHNSVLLFRSYDG